MKQPTKAQALVAALRLAAMDIWGLCHCGECPARKGCNHGNQEFKKCDMAIQNHYLDLAKKGEKNGKV